MDGVTDTTTRRAGFVTSLMKQNVEDLEQRVKKLERNQLKIIRFVITVCSAELLFFILHGKVFK